MKKVFFLSMILAIAFCITGCGCEKKELKTSICTLKKESIDYKLDSIITIKYYEEDNKVVSFEENSTFNSENQELIEDFKNQNDTYYKNYGKYYDCKIEDKTAELNINFDLKKISTKKFIDIDEFNSGFVNGKKVDYQKMIEYYTEFEGYACK